MENETKAPVTQQNPVAAREQSCMGEINSVLEKYLCKFVVVERKVDGVPQKPEIVVVSR